MTLAVLTLAGLPILSRVAVCKFPTFHSIPDPIVQFQPFPGLPSGPGSPGGPGGPSWQPQPIKMRFSVLASSFLTFFASSTATGASTACRCCLRRPTLALARISAAAGRRFSTTVGLLPADFAALQRETGAILDEVAKQPTAIATGGCAAPEAFGMFQLAFAVLRADHFGPEIPVPALQLKKQGITTVYGQKQTRQNSISLLIEDWTRWMYW